MVKVNLLETGVFSLLDNILTLITLIPTLNRHLSTLTENYAVPKVP